MKQKIFTTTAGRAVMLKAALVQALEKGETSILGEWDDAAIMMIEDEFEYAGWHIINHGISVSLRPKV